MCFTHVTLFKKYYFIPVSLYIRKKTCTRHHILGQNIAKKSKFTVYTIEENRIGVYDG